MWCVWPDSYDKTFKADDIAEQKSLFVWPKEDAVHLS